VALVVVLLICYVIYAFATWQNPLGDSGSGTTPGPGKPPTVVGGGQPQPGLPPPEARTTPVVKTFKGCPAQGDGGDPALNRMKNRVDPAPITPVEFETVFALTWPKAVEYKDRANWSPDDAAAVAQYAELPVSLEGYLWGGKKSGMESANCHSTEYFDWHVWLIGKAGQDRTHSIVVEPTPRTLALHPGWELPKITALAKAATRVRVTGWLFLDPEHPNEVDKSRGTIWEIHPITQWEVQVSGEWVQLDDWQP
jgi:hypothetical protein